VRSQTDSNKPLIQQRLIYFFYIPAVLLFLLLGARLWQLQIIQGNQYALRAERNRARTVQITAPRGTITDRNGDPLVENRPSFNIYLLREYMQDATATATFLDGYLGIPREELSARLSRARKSPVYRPLIIKEDVGIDDISTVEAHRRDHPEIQLGPQPRRRYRHNRLAAHVLGYVGEISDEELASEAFAGAKPGDLVGKSGVERIYNQSLLGTDGTRQVLVDSLGRELGVLSEVEAVIGGELRLTLDLHIQSVADSLLADRVGAILVMDPRNGEILAMASAPGFDPNQFSSRLSEADWSELVNDPDHPLQNRVIQSSYPPGSIFKPVMALAGLEQGFLEEGTRVFCRGAGEYYNRVFRCWAPGHGFMNVESALCFSCNIFFYELGMKMGIEKIAAEAAALGLGERTGVDLPAERSGILPSPEWKMRTRGEKWYAGETISVAIGQGALSTTPLQLLRAICAIAMDGRLVTPHLLLNVERGSGPPPSWPVRYLGLNPDHTRLIKNGMWASVNAGGTGGRAHVAGPDICGKTGTVQVIGSERARALKENAGGFADHSWFVGFANRDLPEVAVAVFVEHGGKGGAAAAPLARELFQAYFGNSGQPNAITELTETPRTSRP